MARKIRSARSVSSARPKHRTTTAEGAGKGKRNSEAAPSTFQFECALCGKAKGQADISTVTGEWIVECWVCGSRRYIFALADELGIKGGGYALKADAYQYLKPYTTGGLSSWQRSDAPPPPPPSDYDIREWRRMLREDGAALPYLLEVRGLSREIIAKARIGYDGRAFTVPIKDVRTREMMAVKRRYWPNPHRSGAKYMMAKASKATLYPGVLRESRSLLICCEGELDALVLWRHRLPGVTITAGMTARWRSEWDWAVKDRPVAVIYDAGARAEQQAEVRVAELLRAGAKAWVVPLSEAGLDDGQDVTDWFVTCERSRVDLLALINRERRRKKP
jgi:hypothetical protein